MRSMIVRLTLLVATLLTLSIVAARAFGPVASGGAATTNLSLADLADATPGASHGCSVTGDLVGDANPADVARALCGTN
jgi:hypothetical protein